MNQNFVDNSKIGITIMGGFGVVWAAAIVGLSSLPNYISLAVLALTVTLAVLLVYLAHRREFKVEHSSKSTVRSPKRTCVFIITNVIQAVLFSVTISICIATSNFELIPLYGALIVGVHFIPLAYTFSALSFFMIGAAMSLAGVATLGLYYSELVDAASLVAVVGMVSIVSLLGTATYELHIYSTKPSN